MVHAKAAVMPSSQEVNMEEASQSVQQCMSVVVDQANCAILSKDRATTQRRHRTMISNSLSTIDHLNHLSADMELSSINGSAIRNSMSGNSNLLWNLGEVWSIFRHGKKYAAEATSLSPLDSVCVKNTLAEKLVAKQRMLASSGAGSFDKSGASIGDLWQTVQTGKDLNRVSNDSHSIEISKTSSDLFNWLSSSCHLQFLTPLEETDTARSLHLTSLDVFPSYKFGSTGGLNASPLEELNQLESCDAPLSSRWRQIQGAKNWKGLLAPLDLGLRKEILRYGDLAQITYDNFECESRSKYAGSARFPKQNMFEKLHKQHSGYQVTRYLYATCENPLPGALQKSLSTEPWDVESNWMGYVAVATELREMERLGRRDIVVAWRGTVRTMEWLKDAQIQMAPVTVAVDTSKITKMCPRVEKGFWSLYTCKGSTSQFNQKSASEQVISELTRLLTLYKGENLSITLTGHSLGGALAILTAYEIAELGLNKRLRCSGEEEIIPVTAFTFGSPPVGDGIFRKRFEEMQLKALRVVEVHDLVPKLSFLWMEAYEHVGVELQVNHKLSPYLKPSLDPVHWHSLECYLHLVDGHEGRNLKNLRSFELVTNRDYALVNKYADILQHEYCIPPNWWQLENKGLELSAEGRWVEPNRPSEDSPSLANHERFI